MLVVAVVSLLYIGLVLQIHMVASISLQILLFSLSINLHMINLDQAIKTPSRIGCVRGNGQWYSCYIPC
jgi:hypothetical protein